MAVTGQANKSLVQQFLKKEIDAVGISGFDARLLIAKRKDRLKIRKGKPRTNDKNKKKT